MKTRTIYRRAFAAFLTILLTTVTAQAQIWIAGTQVTDYNAMSTIDGVKGGTISYNTTTNELTLNSVTIDTGDKSAQGMTIGIEGITIVLKGRNSIKGNAQAALKITQNVTFQGDGSLNLTGKDYGLYFDSQSISCYIRPNVKITAQGNQYGICSLDNASTNFTSITCYNGANVTATGNTAAIARLYDLRFIGKQIAITSPEGAAFRRNPNRQVEMPDGSVPQKVVISDKVPARYLVAELNDGTMKAVAETDRQFRFMAYSDGSYAYGYDENTSTGNHFIGLAHIRDISKIRRGLYTFAENDYISLYDSNCYLSPTLQEVLVGDEVRLCVNNSDNENVENNVGPWVRWSASDRRVAKVERVNGVVTVKFPAEGRVTIYARDEKGNTMTVGYVVTRPQPIAKTFASGDHIALYSNGQNIEGTIQERFVGDEVRLCVNNQHNEDVEKDDGPWVYWSTSDESMAKVERVDGVATLTLLVPGTVGVFATDEKGTSKSVFYNVKTHQFVSNSVIRLNTSTEITEAPAEGSAEAFPNDEFYLDIFNKTTNQILSKTSWVKWSSSNESVATVVRESGGTNERALVTAKSTGETTITAQNEDGSQKLTFKLTVKTSHSFPANAVIRLNTSTGATEAPAEGSAEAFFWNEFYLDIFNKSTNQMLPKTSWVKWSSSNERIATVARESEGTNERALVTAKQAVGETTITAQNEDGSQKLTFKLTVKAHSLPANATFITTKKSYYMEPSTVLGGNSDLKGLAGEWIEVCLADISTLEPCARMNWATWVSDNDLVAEVIRYDDRTDERVIIKIGEVGGRTTISVWDQAHENRISFTVNSIKGIEINETNFPDPTFRLCVLGVGGTDDLLNWWNIKNTTSMDIAGYRENWVEIESIKGIEFFTELTSLYCQYNKLTSLDLSNNTKLVELGCHANQISSLKLGKNTALKELYCEANKLKSLDLSGNMSLEVLSCYGNDIKTLDISWNPYLILAYKNGTVTDTYHYIGTKKYNFRRYEYSGYTLEVDKDVTIITE